MQVKTVNANQIDLWDAKGYPQLLDFTLSKKLSDCGGRAFTLCGLAVLSTYSIDREAHEENLAEALRRRKGSDLSLHSRHSSDPPELGADDAADDSGEPLVGRCSGLEP